MRKVETVHGNYAYVDPHEVSHFYQVPGAVYNRDEPHTEVVMKNGGVLELRGVPEDVAVLLGLGEGSEGVGMNAGDLAEEVWDEWMDGNAGKKSDLISILTRKFGGMMPAAEE